VYAKLYCTCLQRAKLEDDLMPWWAHPWTIIDFCCPQHGDFAAIVRALVESIERGERSDG
jgi:hypothetical protein